MKKLLLITLLALLPTLAHADDDDDDANDTLAAEDVLLDRNLAAGAKTNPLHLVVHKAGHLQSKPYVIEISETCQNGEQVIDTHSACDVAVNTAGYRPGASEIEMLVREPAENASGCSAQAKKVVFRLQSRCQQ